MKVALLQFNASADKSDNLRRAVGMATKAVRQGATFILLPEIFNFRGDARQRPAFLQAQESIPGDSTAPFIDLARRHKTFFLLGSILEKAPAGRAYNSSVLINERGAISAKYRKIHLFDANIGDKIIRESDNFCAGTKPVTAAVGSFKMGLSICYDLRFADLYQGYSRRGVDILTVPACFTRKTGEAHWSTLLRARAIENLCYVLAPAQVGMDARGIPAYGHSMIVSPWGEVIAEGSGDKEEIIFGNIKKEEIKKARQILPGIVRR